MPFVVCPSCSQHNFTAAAEQPKTRKCTRCGQIFWVKTADRGVGARKALVDRAASAMAKDGRAAAA